MSVCTILKSCNAIREDTSILSGSGGEWCVLSYTVRHLIRPLEGEHGGCGTNKDIPPTHNSPHNPKQFIAQ